MQYTLTSTSSPRALKLSPLCLLLGLLLPALQTEAAIGISSVSYAEPTDVAPFISSTDLVNAGSISLLSVSSSPFFGIPNVNDGSTNQAYLSEEESHYTATIEFNLDVSEHTLGYSIDSISMITGLSQFESQITPWFTYFGELSVQLVTLSYSLVGEAAFHELITVSDSSPAGIRRVTLIGLDEEIGGGVDALRFTWQDPFPVLAPGTFPDESWTAIREIDVFGSPIPEPSSWLLCAIGALGLLRRRR